jgi:hypothetical protein
MYYSGFVMFGKKIVYLDSKKDNNKVLVKCYLPRRISYYFSSPVNAYLLKETLGNTNDFCSRLKVKLVNLEIIKFDKIVLKCFKQCCGAGAARSRIFWSEPEP